jgi:ubiquinone biosynthesis protein
MLNPEFDMWQLARPLVEAWMVENRGPEARLRDGIEGVGALIARLPDFARHAEAVAAQLADGGLRLHPDTVEALAAGRGGGKALLWPLWGAVLLLFLILLALI